MNAKEYLQSIKQMELKIFQKKKELELMINERTYAFGIDYAAEKVKSSPSSESFTKISNKILDMQNEINDDMDKLTDSRHKIIEQIQVLSKIEYSDILFKRYVEGKRFEAIASEMNYSYYRVIHMHGEALIDFENMHLKTS